MRSKLKLLPVIIFILGATRGLSQELPGTNVKIPPSPGAVSQAQFAETAVNMYSGIPSINIPLGNVSGKQIGAPINLSYLASGRRVDEIASWVGLGWTLNAGGVITRVVRGRPDEQTYGFLDFAGSVPTAGNMNSLDSLELLAGNAYDMVSDLYFLNAGGISGKFVFGNDGQPLLIPRGDIKIEADIKGIGNTNSFTVTLPNGVVYKFGGSGYTEETTAVYMGPSLPTYSSSWYLTEIISPDKTDTIKFTYATGYNFIYPNVTSKSYKYYFGIANPAEASHTEGEVSTISKIHTNEVQNIRDLSSIEFTNGKIEFVRSIGRLDVTTSQASKLDYINLYSKDAITGSYVLDKTFHLIYSYFQNTLGNAKRLRLDKIEQSSGSINLPSYTFDYFEDTALPEYGSYAQDHWGYYNRADGNTSLIPEFIIGLDTLEKSNTREPDFNGTLAAMLKNIHYPSGGVVTYEFELNEYSDSGNNYSAGGLRVKSITATDPFSQIRDVTSYTYSTPGNEFLSSGALIGGFQYSSTMTVKDKYSSTNDQLISYYGCGMLMGNPVGLGSNNGGPVAYEYVTRYKGDGYAQFGKSVFRYSTINDVGSNWLPFAPVTDNSWERGRLLEEKHYKYIDANTLHLVSETINQYQTSSVFKMVKGLKVSYAYILEGHFIPLDPALTKDDFSSVNYEDYSKFMYLSTSTSTTYDPDDPLKSSSQTTTYSYDHTDKHLMLSSVVTNTSDGKQIETEYTYPLDYTHLGVLGTMQDQNIIGIPVEKKVWEIEGVNKYLINYSKIDFQAIAESGYSRIYPQYAYAGKLDEPVLKSTFDATPTNYYEKVSTSVYDVNGNLVESHKEGGEKSTVVYERNGTQAVAVVANAAQDEVAYTGFEANDFGNWTFEGGLEQRTKTGYVGSPFSSLQPQTLLYSWNITQTQGEPALIIFTEVNGGATTIEQIMAGSVGSGSASLAAGEWVVTLSYGTNVTSISVTFDVEYTHYFQADYNADHKTGAFSILLNPANSITKTNLPAGNYLLTYWQKSGTPIIALSGSGSIISTSAHPVGADGWTLVEKLITIGSTTDTITLSGSCFIDDLRLHPTDALMSTKSYDSKGNLLDTTGPNYISTFYEYDDLGRVKLIRDKDKNIIKQYEYTFAN